MIIRILFLLVLMFFSFEVKATKSPETVSLSQIPILHEGRIKPLETVALNYYKWFSGDFFVSLQEANAWFFESLFEPEKAINKPLFKVSNERVLKKIAPETEGAIISFAQLSRYFEENAKEIQAIFQTPKSDKSEEEEVFADLYEKSQHYIQILQSFSLFLPLEVSKELSFFKASSVTPSYQDQLKAIIKAKGQNIATYSDEEKQIALIAFHLDLMSVGGEVSSLLKIIPTKEQWYSPWAYLLKDKEHQKDQGLIVLQELVDAYRVADEVAFEEALTSFRDINLSVEVFEDSLTRNRFEHFYNWLNPYRVSFIAYFLALFLFGGLWLISGKEYFVKTSVAMIGIGALSHGVALVLRMLILERPPVGTLYETILFVSFISVVCSVFLYLKSKNNIYLFCGGFVALILLSISRFFLSGQDSLHVLMAVLNTNFWLTTHVTIITIGYALCLVCALMAHCWLFTPKVKKEFRNTLFTHTYFVGILALLFVLVGTVLGGIWADQSWGRFWGWDPKENGALLIVLWLVWTLHGRLSGLINRYFFMVSLAFLTVIVVLSWFGVNLLSVGLHSYGFTTGLAEGIVGFVLLQIVILSFAYYKYKREIQAIK